MIPSTPWKRSAEGRGTGPCIADVDGQLVARIFPSHADYENNMETILLCVNSHDELLAFVKEKTQGDCFCDEPEPGESGTIECDRCRALKIISKIEK